MTSTVLHLDECNCCLLSVFNQWRLHTSPRHMFTGLPQQTVSCQSQNNILQEDTDGRRNLKHSHTRRKKAILHHKRLALFSQCLYLSIITCSLIITVSVFLLSCIFALSSSSSGDDQQWFHSRQRGLRVLHKGGQHGHSQRRLLRHFSCNWWFGRWYSVFHVKTPSLLLKHCTAIFSYVKLFSFITHLYFLFIRIFPS